VHDHPLLHAPTEVPGGVAARAREQEWPEVLLRRAADMRVPRADVQMWLDNPQFDASRVSWLLDVLAKTFDGPLRVREATWRDGDSVAELYANAPKGVGDGAARRWRSSARPAPARRRCSTCCRGSTT
jgi:hypothetical protein